MLFRSLVDAEIARMTEIYEYYDPWHLKNLVKGLEAWRATAWSTLAQREAEANKLYKKESPELKAALKKILWDLTREGESIVSQMQAGSDAQLAQISEWSAKVQKSLDAAATKAEDYMGQFLKQTEVTFFDWVNQEPKKNGYIVLLD